MTCIRFELVNEEAMDDMDIYEVETRTAPLLTSLLDI